MSLWLHEKQTENLKMATQIETVLYNAKSDFQTVQVLNSKEFGRMLVLDGVFQTSLKDEFVYHEMIAHIPLMTHKNPEKVLIIGGGDGGTAREVLKHKKVKNVDMVEIDGMVVEACKKYLPEIAVSLNDNKDKRFNLIVGDGILHVKEHQNYYDVIIVDCSDPIGPGLGLFTTPFYQSLEGSLKQDGLFVQQTESPWYHQDLIKYIYGEINQLFPLTKMYLAHIPLYPGGVHSFVLGSKVYDPIRVSKEDVLAIKGLKYLNYEYFQASFALPEFMKNILPL